MSDGAIRACLTADDRTPTPHEVAARCGAGARCSGCVDAIQAVIDGHDRTPTA